jgi:hypothetical protein
MKPQKLALIGLGTLALFLQPTLSTVGVTGAQNLQVGETEIVQALPINSFVDHVVMSSIDNQISAAIEAQR